MKNLYKVIPLALIALTACADADATVETPQTVSGSTAVSSSSEEASAQREIPLIAINTKDSSAGNDFVDLPIDSYVANSMASWTPGFVIPPAPYYEKCTVTVTDTDGSVLTGDADVKVRGNWTTSYEKKPLRIKFDKKQKMLGLNNDGEFKNWVLLAEYKDLSMLRDRAALDISKEILGTDGYYSADSRLVEVEINGDYRGVYLLTEQQQTGKGRVDIPEPEKDYTEPDIGYFLEFDGYYANEEPLRGFTITYSDNAPLLPFDGNGGSRQIKPLCRDIASGFTIKSDINSQKQHDTIESYIENVYRIMYAAAYEDTALAMTPDYSDVTAAEGMTPEEAVKAVVDVQSLADMYILCELTCDADIYWSSFFMSVDLSSSGSKKLTFEAPWDFDSSMGNKDRCVYADQFYTANIVMDVNDEYELINPWLTVLMYEDWFQDIIREKWTAVSDSGAPARTVEMILSESETLHDAFERNYKRWNNMKDKSVIINELNQFSGGVNSQQEAADQLAGWLSDRIEFMDSKWK